ncbi:MAG: energy-coupling factor transport system ATP-binding protein [Clostridiales bacterium]|jgi:energy-coupling factor transport system ATP-binding protein|nr:energy-coupling factor transport system ATP-binding protein [Clostridiales bacterium]MDN5280928.1 energy-coupling factor transport system ATP-binding protein [Candidatus Ozemobacter sp.]
MILFDRVSFRYKSNEETSFAIREVSFSCRQNLIHGFIGGNGSGKSTYARLIAGLLHPEAGKIEVCGLDTSAEDAQIHRKVGIIFQNPDNQIVGTTVEEDIAFGLENLAIPTNDMPEKIQQIAEEMGIENLLKKPVHHLSGGQKQLLCIASVLVMQPEWLIFDEPTSHLDPWSRRNFWKMLEILKQQRQVGIIVISQVSDDFENFDSIRLFADGDLVFTGSPEELKVANMADGLIHLPEKWQFEKLREAENA